MRLPLQAHRLCGLVTVFTPASDLFAATLWSELLLYRYVDYKCIFLNVVYFIIVPRVHFFSKPHTPQYEHNFSYIFVLIAECGLSIYSIYYYLIWGIRRSACASLNIPLVNILFLLFCSLQTLQFLQFNQTKRRSLAILFVCMTIISPEGPKQTQCFHAHVLLCFEHLQ